MKYATCVADKQALSSQFSWQIQENHKAALNRQRKQILNYINP